MKKNTKKETKELCILVVFLVVLFIFIGIMAVNEKKNPDTTSTESMMSEIQTTDEKTTAEEISSEETSSKVDSDDKNDDYILTVDNCKEFADLLKTDNSDYIQKFVDKYKNYTIKFDGYIYTKAKHVFVNPLNGKKSDDGDYYDISIYPGDYENFSGPWFWMEDVNSHDLGYGESYLLPNFVHESANVIIIAKIKNYNSEMRRVDIQPIKLEER